MAHEHTEHHDDHEHMNLPKYVGIFFVLVVGTILTYITAGWDLDVIFPGANTLLALLIAFTKMAFVVLFFMHVWWNSKLIWLTFAGSFVFLAIMFAFTIQDYATRDSGTFNRTEAVKNK